jgi:pyruvate,water dikinase
MALQSDVDIYEPGPVHQTSRPGTVWTTINAAEQIPGILTPLGFTYWIGPCDRGVKATFATLGALRRDEVTLGATPDERVGGAFFGRWVANVDEFRRLADLIPGVSGAAFEEDVFGSSRPHLPSRSRPTRYPVIAVRAPLALARLPREVRRATAETLSWWRDMTSSAGRQRPGVEQLREAHARLQRIVTLQMLCALVGQAMFDKLGELATTAGDPGLHLRLASGYGGLEELRMISAIYDVASGRTTIEQFLELYGARCAGEIELSAVSWREDHQQVRNLVEKYRTAATRSDPLKRAHRHVAERLAAERELLSRLPAARRPAAKLLFRIAATFIPLRETGKSVLATVIDGGRSAARCCGRDLAAAGVVEDPEDVFFLTLDEVLDPPPRAAELVVRRRALHDAYQRLDVPTLWTGTPEPILAKPNSDEPVEEVRGIGAAPGVAHGTARVIVDADRCSELEADEVLVCRITDPSWASAFHLAAAVVIDIGGLSSHGAIISRELGLPCVINTGNGTQVIRTGDDLRVDGATGTVTVLRA